MSWEHALLNPLYRNQAAPLLPYELDFSTEADGALPTGWTGATWAIASGVAVNTPTDGANRVANPEITVDTTGYAPQNNPIISRVDSASDPGVISPGADAWVLKIAYNGTINPSTIFSLFGMNIVAGQWYRVSALGFAPSANVATNAAIFKPTDNLGGGNFTVTAEDEWQLLCNLVVRALGSAGTSVFWCLTSSAGDVAYFDKWFVAPVSGLIATFDANQPDVIVSGKWTIPANFVGGIVALSDGTLDNCLVAYHDRTTAYLLQYVSGVVSVLVSGAAAYAAGRTIEIRVSNNGTVAKLYYNDIKIAADQAPNAAIQANTKCGLFSTGGATCSLFTVVGN